MCKCKAVPQNRRAHLVGSKLVLSSDEGDLKLMYWAALEELSYDEVKLGHILTRPNWATSRREPLHMLTSYTFLQFFNYSNLRIMPAPGR